MSTPPSHYRKHAKCSMYTFRNQYSKKYFPFRELCRDTFRSVTVQCRIVDKPGSQTNWRWREPPCTSMLLSKLCNMNLKISFFLGGSNLLLWKLNEYTQEQHACTSGGPIRLKVAGIGGLSIWKVGSVLICENRLFFNAYLKNYWSHKNGSPIKICRISQGKRLKYSLGNLEICFVLSFQNIF